MSPEARNVFSCSTELQSKIFPECLIHVSTIKYRTLYVARSSWGLDICILKIASTDLSFS